MHWIYILYSKKIDKFYIGSSADVDKRLAFHNSDYNKIWSKRGQPWEIVFRHKFQSKKEALMAEKFIKNQKSRTFIQKLIEEGWKG